MVFLHHVVAVAFPALPTLNAARKALRQGRVLVDGVVKKQHDALAPVPGRVSTTNGRSTGRSPVVETHSQMITPSRSQQISRLAIQCCHHLLTLH